MFICRVGVQVCAFSGARFYTFPRILKMAGDPTKIRRIHLTIPTAGGIQGLAISCACKRSQFEPKSMPSSPHIGRGPRSALSMILTLPPRSSRCKWKEAQCLGEGTNHAQARNYRHSCSGGVGSRVGRLAPLLSGPHFGHL